MELSLHILREDLASFDMQGQLGASVVARKLTRPKLCAGVPEKPDPTVLYIVAADDMSDEPPVCARLSVICIGEPTPVWKASNHDVLWCAGDADATELMNALVELFWRYNAWESELRSVVENAEPLERIAEVSQPFFPNPFAALSVSFRMLFASYPDVDAPDERYEAYKASTASNGTAFMSDQDIVSVISDKSFSAVSAATHPVLFDVAAYDYKTLVYNVTIDGAPCAYLCSDDILVPHTPRSYSLMKFLGDMLGAALKHENVYPLMHPDSVHETLNALVEHRKMVPEKHVEEAMRYFGWNAYDEFVVMVLAIREDTDQAAALDALGLSLARATTDDCYLVVGSTIVFVFNLSSMNLTRQELIGVIQPLLGPLWLDASVSSCFHDFKDLYYFYCQAKDAGWIGWHKDSTRDVYPFEDYAVDYIVANLGRKTIPAVYVPDGLNRLIAHDRENGTDYARLLSVFLKNERNTALTVRQEYMHRNTFNYRLKRIADILDMDLNDSDVRFRLLVAFRMLEY